MQKSIEGAFIRLGRGLVRCTAEIAVFLLGGRAGGIADRLRSALANSYFEVGDYVSAKAHFASVGPGRHAAKALQMIGWIDFKLGDFSRGWPLYTDMDFNPDVYVAQTNHVDGRIAAPITVEDPKHPVALVTELGLRRWQPGMQTRLPVLVWFNFKASLGGELLCAKILKRLADIHQLPMVLAADARLGEVLRASFPGCEVIDRKSDLSALAGRCSALLLARDALALVVRSQSDFEAVAAVSLTLPSARHRRAGRRPQVAISWKTTNRTQGRFRNLPIEAFVALIARFDIDFHSAQHGHTAAEERSLRAALGDRIHFNTIDPNASVASLASSLASMDSVVTIDNSVLHIAGAFGMPTIGLLSVPSYWAWPASGPDSRWYDSVFLIHQQRAGEWSGALAELASHFDNLG